MAGQLTAQLARRGFLQDDAPVARVGDGSAVRREGEDCALQDGLALLPARHVPGAADFRIKAQPLRAVFPRLGSGNANAGEQRFTVGRKGQRIAPDAVETGDFADQLPAG
jgi:hypothetical protein